MMYINIFIIEYLSTHNPYFFYITFSLTYSTVTKMENDSKKGKSDFLI